MTFLHYHYLLLLSSLIFLATTATTTESHSDIVLPVQKDPATGLHVATVFKRTPALPVPLLVDLNGQFLTVNCKTSGPYLSSEYDAPLCSSTQCSRAAGPIHTCHTCSTTGGTAYPGCHNGTCGITVNNPLTGRTALGELAQDTLSLRWASGEVATVQQFLFVCAPPDLLSLGLPREAEGVAGLSHSHVSLTTQLASKFGFQPKFATCLASGNGNGAVFFGNGPYTSIKLAYTRLTVNQAGEFSIALKGIRINNKPVRTALTRAIISSTVPFTVLEHSLFAAVTRFFANQLGRRVPRVKPVGPFGLCFETGRVRGSTVGPVVPPIHLVLENGPAESWRIIGANLMVEVGPGTTCLAFVDGGVAPGRAAMVIGAYQLEDNLVQFDLANSVLGFSSSLLFQRTSCSNYNFTT